MMLGQHLTEKESGQEWNYVGTIWGPDEWDGTSEDFAQAIRQFDGDGEMIDHPAYGGRDGFYEQSGNIHYNGHLVDECVLQRK